MAEGGSARQPHEEEQNNMDPEFPMGILLMLPFLEFAESPSPNYRVTKSVITAAFQREDKKYDINFDVPARDWPLEDKKKMRVIMRDQSIIYKKCATKIRIRQLRKKFKNASSKEKALAREIVDLYKKDCYLMKYMTLRDLAFSTFGKQEYDWRIIAHRIGNKYSPAECKEYWFMDLYPNLKNMGFNVFSNKKLIDYIKEYKFRNWDKISAKMIGHTEYQCYVHFRRNLYKTIEGWNIEKSDKKSKKST